MLRDDRADAFTYNYINSSNISSVLLTVIANFAFLLLNFLLFYSATSCLLFRTTKLQYI